MKSKPEIGAIALLQALRRIMNGEQGLIEKIKDYYSITPDQIWVLEYKQNEYLEKKLANEGTINNLTIPV